MSQFREGEREKKWSAKSCGQLEETARGAGCLFSLVFTDAAGFVSKGFKKRCADDKMSPEPPVSVAVSRKWENFHKLQCFRCCHTKKKKKVFSELLCLKQTPRLVQYITKKGEINYRIAT